MNLRSIAVQISTIYLKELIVMNILVTLNSGYLGPLCVMLHSLCESNPTAQFRIFVAHTSLEESAFKKIQASVCTERCRIENVHVPQEKFPGLPYSKRWPQEACYRIFAAHILPPDVDRVLYLDPDIVIINSIEQLYNIDLQGKYFAAATHLFEIMQVVSRVRLKMPPKSVYINSGVMLIDLKRLREEQQVEQVLEYYRNNKIRIRLFDQDILNGLYCEQTLVISALLYNLDERYFKLHNLNPYNKTNKIDHQWVADNTSIIHFCGKTKPWNAKYKGQFGGLFYDEYSKKVI